ncbi:hypothetical protein [Piscinibacter sp.]|uniref:hypothetical protein n=1 Tax=Piscinibacter sp. TaxID=1903157 RepID=UPI0035B21FB7
MSDDRKRFRGMGGSRSGGGGVECGDSGLEMGDLADAAPQPVDDPVRATGTGARRGWLVLLVVVLLLGAALAAWLLRR